MKTTVSYNDFRDAFRNYDRLDNFPDSGLRVLFDWLEEYELDIGKELELDVIGFCCNFAQSTFEEVARDYQIEIDPDLDLSEQVIEYLQDNTMVVGTIGENQVIFQIF